MSLLTARTQLLTAGAFGRGCCCCVLPTNLCDVVHVVVNKILFCLQRNLDGLQHKCDGMSACMLLTD